MKQRNEQILVVGPSWVGDMVMSQSLYIHLKQTRPGACVDVLAPPWSAPILERMPEVDGIIPKRIGHGELALGRRRRLGRKLRPTGYDQAIVLPNSLKSALVPLLARIPRRTGWRGEMRFGFLNDLRRLDERALPLMVERFVALGQDPQAPLPEPLPRPRLCVDAAAAADCRRKFQLEDGRPLLALCPGAEFGGAKRWPAEYYAELASVYLARGWQVALFGSDNDRPVTGPIRAATGSPHCHDLAGRTSLAEVVDTLSMADAVVSNDSGLMHIAAALDRPLLAIYGATSPGFTPPLGERASTLVSTIECAPCFERECPLGHHRCMRDTLPPQVTDKLDVLLQDHKES